MVSNHPSYSSCQDDFHFPTLSELNDDVAPYPWRSDDERLRFLASNTIDSQPAFYTGPPPAPLTHVPPSIPAISDLATSIIRSSDNLFFISWHRHWYRS